VQSLLGIVPLAPYRCLIVDPSLPEWLPELLVEDLRVGEATATLRFWREADGSSSFEVLAKRGTLRIIRQPPAESRHAGPGERLRDLIQTVVA
jgi:hypothetical protein